MITFYSNSFYTVLPIVNVNVKFYIFIYLFYNYVVIFLIPKYFFNDNKKGIKNVLALGATNNSTYVLRASKLKIRHCL